MSTTTSDPRSAPARAAAVPPAAGSRVRRARRHGDAIGAATLLSLTVVVGLWLSQHGLQDLGAGTAPALTSLGRILGLSSADLLLLQCLMMARIPWAERTWGQDRLARWHRVLGFTSFHAMLAHVVLITLGYAAGEGTSVPAMAWDLVWHYPGMLLATAGALLLVLVTVTSIRRARAKLRYESWHLLHLYAYLGVGLALPHQLWAGTEFVGSPGARAYWWTLWICAAAAVVVFRVGLPLCRTVRHDVRVAAVVTERPGVVSVHLRGRALERLPARAGQFLVLRFRDGPGWSRANPYSLSAAPHPSMLRVTIQDVGDGSARAAALRPGTAVMVEGPYGRLTADARTDPARPVLLVGSGVGITPLRALLEEIDAPGRVTLIQRSRSEQDVLFGSELDALGRARGARIVHLVGPRARDRSWLPASELGETDAQGLARLVPDIAASEVYVCGPVGWADAVVAAARAAGVPAARIHQERFAW